MYGLFTRQGCKQQLHTGLHKLKKISAYRTSRIPETTDFKNVFKGPVNRSNQEDLVKVILTKEENWVAQAVKAVHWPGQD